ncbi:conserved membrane hypothetical protein [Desulfosarcina cetonica]|nr:conserved membrane hypothetical protein [Desulfosarcina cetonica]
MMPHLLLPAMGGVLLLMGRRLFWLFVGVCGFAVGIQAAPLLFGPQPFAVIWAIGLGCGILGALLALFAQQLAVVVGGFLAGATLALNLLPPAGAQTFPWVVLVCAVVGAVATFLLFDWALIVLSAMLGAALIVDGMGLQWSVAVAIYLVLILIGVVVQAGWMRRHRRVP